VVELIGATTTKSGLTVESTLDMRSYRKGIKVSTAQGETVGLNGVRCVSAEVERPLVAGLFPGHYYIIYG
jgi:hypothetical protein